MSKFVSVTKLPFHAGLGHIANLIEGGKEGLIELARASEHAAMKRICASWDALRPSDRVRVPIERICESEEFPPSAFLAELVRALYEQNMDVAKLIAITSQPGLVAKAVEYAARPSGHKHLEMLFKATGFLPTPQGSRINIAANANATAAVAQVQGLPSFESVMIESSNRTVNVSQGTDKQGD